MICVSVILYWQYMYNTNLRQLPIITYHACSHTKYSGNKVEQPHFKEQNPIKYRDSREKYFSNLAYIEHRLNSQLQIKY